MSILLLRPTWCYLFATQEPRLGKSYTVFRSKVVDIAQEGFTQRRKGAEKKLGGEERKDWRWRRRRFSNFLLHVSRPFSPPLLQTTYFTGTAAFGAFGANSLPKKLLAYQRGRSSALASVCTVK